MINSVVTSDNLLRVVEILAVRILIVASMYPSEKNPYYGSFVKGHVEILQRKGIKCQVVANRDSRRGSFNALRKYTLLAVQVLITSVRGDFDVIHAHTTFFAGIIAVFAAQLRRKPVIVTVHGTDDVGRFLQRNFLYKHKRLAKWLARMCLRRADHIIAVSNYLRGLLITEMGISDRKISVIDMGVNPDVFRPMAKKEARKQLNLPLSEEMLLYVGSLHPAKGVDYLMEAVTLLERPNCRLVIVGDGQERERLKSLADSLGLLVTFVGVVPKEKVPLWMSAADLLVHPTLSEGFGLVVLEASSCGLPVVASNVGAIPDIIDDGVNGYLIEPADAAALATGIEKSLKESAQLSSHSRQVALNHDVNLQVERVLAAYNTVAGYANDKGAGDITPKTCTSR